MTCLAASLDALAAGLWVEQLETCKLHSHRVLGLWEIIRGWFSMMDGQVAWLSDSRCFGGGVRFEVACRWHVEALDVVGPYPLHPREHHSRAPLFQGVG